MDVGTLVGIEVRMEVKLTCDEDVLNTNNVT